MPSDWQRTIGSIERESQKFQTRNRNGATTWRIWGSGPKVVLLHGGHGSWTHWIRNVLDLSRSMTVLVPDMPGFGESDAPPEPHHVNDIVDGLLDGLREICTNQSRFSIVGFSFGSVIGAALCRWCEPMVDRFIMVGPGRLRTTPVSIPKLRNWRLSETNDERLSAHRTNLGLLMIHDPARIDCLSVHLQAQNTDKTRVKSRTVRRIEELLKSLEGMTAPLSGVWGACDVIARDHMAERKEILLRFDPAAEFIVIDNAGHWVQYERAEEFNRILIGLVAAPRERGRNRIV